MRNQENYKIETEYLEKLRVAYNSILKINPDCDLRNIIHICKLTTTETNKLKKFIQDDFKVHFRSRMRSYKNVELIDKLRKYEENSKKFRYAETLIDVNLYSTINTHESDNRKIPFKKGTIVEFSYFKEVCNLYVFYFDDDMLFPLKPDEFKWI